MDEQRVREVIREELSKARVCFEIGPSQEGDSEFAGEASLVARLSLPEKPEAAAGPAGKRH